MQYRSEDYYEKMHCDVLYGKKAVKIDDASKTVILDDGSALPYTAVCVATGSVPFVPPFSGLDTVSKKFSFMTLDDTLALETAVTPSSKVLIIGAGLIGLKCAEGLKERVAEITVCDLADRVLSSILDYDCASIMQKHLEENGIKFLLNDSVETFESDTATMKSGKKVDFDVLVLAVGVRANVSLVRDIGGEVNRGILVNDHMETTRAQGICCGRLHGRRRYFLPAKKGFWLFCQTRICKAIAQALTWPAAAMLFDNPIPMNSIGFFGLHSMTAGTYFGKEDGGEMYEEKTDGKLKTSLYPQWISYRIYFDRRKQSGPVFTLL